MCDMHFVTKSHADILYRLYVGFVCYVDLIYSDLPGCCTSCDLLCWFCFWLWGFYLLNGLYFWDYHLGFCFWLVNLDGFGVDLGIFWFFNYVDFAYIDCTDSVMCCFPHEIYVTNLWKLIELRTRVCLLISVFFQMLWY